MIYRLAGVRDNAGFSARMLQEIILHKSRGVEYATRPTSSCGDNSLAYSPAVSPAPGRYYSSTLS